MLACCASLYDPRNEKTVSVRFGRQFNDGLFGQRGGDLVCTHHGMVGLGCYADAFGIQLRQLIYKGQNTGKFIGKSIQLLIGKGQLCQLSQLGDLVAIHGLIRSFWAI